MRTALFITWQLTCRENPQVVDKGVLGRSAAPELKLRVWLHESSPSPQQVLIYVFEKRGYCLPHIKDSAYNFNDNIECCWKISAIFISILFPFPPQIIILLCSVFDSILYRLYLLPLYTCTQNRRRHFGTSNSNHLTETVAIAICRHQGRGHVCQRSAESFVVMDTYCHCTVTGCKNGSHRPFHCPSFPLKPV